MLHWIAAHKLLVFLLSTPAGLLAAALIAAAALRRWPARAEDAPTVELPAAPRQPTHAAGHVDQVDDTTARTGPRHAGIGAQRWRPMHTRRAVARRGRHHTGDRTWLGWLETQAADVTVDDLAEAMEAHRG
ncbi:hypothetical protein ABT297_04250 [Dactylosporangium sp. NPDC000555]|uniref:hypothetical protein n=1 Tax=Dactylosporangium sp. NPDC000555 TaxID=3154260 RepID=UPI003320D91F